MFVSLVAEEGTPHVYLFSHGSQAFCHQLCIIAHAARLGRIFRRDQVAHYLHIGADLPGRISKFDDSIRQGVHRGRGRSWIACHAEWVARSSHRTWAATAGITETRRGAATCVVWASQGFTEVQPIASRNRKVLGIAVNRPMPMTAEHMLNIASHQAIRRPANQASFTNPARFVTNHSMKAVHISKPMIPCSSSIRPYSFSTSIGLLNCDSSKYRILVPPPPRPLPMGYSSRISRKVRFTLPPILSVTVSLSSSL